MTSKSIGLQGKTEAPSSLSQTVKTPIAYFPTPFSFRYLHTNHLGFFVLAGDFNPFSVHVLMIRKTFTENNYLTVWYMHTLGYRRW